MAIATLVPLSEYLSRTYHPDCDYLDGVLEERNVGEIGHSDAQSAINAYVRNHYPGFWSGVEVRVQVDPNRFRIPDVTIVRGGRPAGRVITSPPDVAVEVLSPEDRAASIQSRIDDYLGRKGCAGTLDASKDAARALRFAAKSQESFGVPCIWVVDPESRRAWIHTNDGSREAKDGVLRNVAGDLAVPLAAIF